MNWLMLLIVNGLFGSLMSAVFGRQETCRVIALLNTVISIIIFYQLSSMMDFTNPSLQLVERFSWIPFFNIDLFLAIDGVSWTLVALTLLINLIVIFSTFVIDSDRLPFFLSLFLLMQAMVIGVFLAFDAILYYFFWEGMLLPMYLCIGIWGSSNRHSAAIKFFLYTFLGSLLMLVALIYMGIQAGGFSFNDLQNQSFTLTEQVILFCALMAAFAVKVPMFPLHTWLPDAHTEAPAAGSVVLAALMLKVGAYGFIRLSLPILPDASQLLAPLMITLSMISIIYVGVLAYTQTDIKRLIAYSSVAHMGFVTLGLFLVYYSNNQAVIEMGYIGAIVQMISHAFGSGALFLAFGMLYHRHRERAINQLSGLGTQMPIFSAFFMLFTFSTIGVPFTAGFVGEWMVIVSTVQNIPWLGILSASSIILAAIYLLNMYQSVFFGMPKTNIVALSDLCKREMLILSLVALVILGLGIYPNLMIKVLTPSAKSLISVSTASKIGGIV